MANDDVPTDRKTARRMGSKVYQGRRCDWGHAKGLRYTSDGSCIGCQRENAQSKKLADRYSDKLRRKAWRIENADKVKAQNARAYARRKGLPLPAIVDDRQSDQPAAMTGELPTIHPLWAMLLDD